MKLTHAALLIAVPCLTVQAEVLATVGKNKITVEDFSQRYREVRRQTANPPPPEEFLEDLVRLEIGAQEAERHKLQDDPLVKDRYKQILYSVFLEKQLGDRLEKIKITEKDLREYYMKNPEFRLAHILVNSREKAVAVLNEAKSGKRPFEELARANSEDGPSKDSGGDLGFQTKLTLPSVVYIAARDMKVGEAKGPVQTPAGFHVLKLLEKRAFDLADKHMIRTALLEERRDQIFNDYFAKTKKAYKVEVNKEALKSLTQ